MVKDNFEREGRWDSVGLDCSTCQHFKSPLRWPDKNHEVFCNFHKVSLTVELGKDDYKLGEWFCKDFKDKGGSVKNSVRHFEKIKDLLGRGILYGFEKKGANFKEIKIRGSSEVPGTQY